MTKLIGDIFQKEKAEVKIRKRVTAIDYSGDNVKVTTSDKKTFTAKKVISSLPLGVLKKGVVTFTPTLPKGYTEAIEDIGFGVVDKLFVKFDVPFWKAGSKWLNFVTRNFDDNFFPSAYVDVRSVSHTLIFYIPSTFSL